MQQAETVRLVSGSGLISITDLSPDMEIIGWSGGAGRHVGIEISADVTEK